MSERSHNPSVPRQAPRCSCGYALKGLRVRNRLVRCPECGREQHTDGAGVGTRRQPTYAWVVIEGMFLLGAACTTSAAVIALVMVILRPTSIWLWLWLCVLTAGSCFSFAAWRHADRLGPRSPEFGIIQHVMAFALAIASVGLPCLPILLLYI